MCFRSKFSKLTREDVVDSICKLETECDNIEKGIIDKQAHIQELTAKGKVEKNREIRLFYAKKINSLKGELEQDTQRAMYLMYNIQLLNKLKRAIDDNQFFKKTSKMALGNLLNDQVGLAKFLNKTLNTRVSAETVLTDADETFKEVESQYEKNESIYGVGSNDDELLAVFEDAETAEMDYRTEVEDSTPKSDAVSDDAAGE